MTAPKRRPTGRLPARVYWFRRALVLGTALALVVVVARVLTGSATPSPQHAAKTIGAVTSPSAAAGPLGPAAVQSTTIGGTPTGSAPPAALAQPDGPCAIDEVTVTPVLTTAKAGAPIPLALELSGIRPACTFEVSANSLVAKVTAGSKRIWSSQDCPHSVPTSSVVVRSGAPTTVQVTWSGRYSDSQCSRASDWALPGSYQLAASAIGSEPGQATLKLVAPPRPVVTKTIHPKVKKQKPVITTKKGTKTPATGRRSNLGG